MRRLTAAVAAAVLVLFGSVVLAGTASAAPGDVTITAPGEGGEDTTPLVQGTADPGTEVHVLIDENEVAVVTATQDGTWEYQVTTPFTRGTSVAISAQVEVPGSASSAAISYYCWPEPVQITITSPSPGSVTGPSLEVRARVQGSNRNLSLNLLLDDEVVVDDVPFDDIDAGTLLAATSLPDIADGPHTLQIVGTDDLGRRLASQVVSVIGDGTPPPAPVLLSPAPGSTVTTKHFTFHGTGTPGDTVHVMYDRSGEPVSDQVVVRPDGTFDAPVYANQQPPFNPFDGLGRTRRTLSFYLVEADPFGNQSSTGFSLTIDLRPAPAATPTPTPSATPPASAVPAADPGATPAAGAPELANTGPSTLPGTATALLLIAFGLGLTRASRRLAPARR